ncbi:MAG TPA: hypothetical protein VK427_23035, partial [Kofleriaceae bacterium]|nr:hypothetical protein [Kofleriaceae bacterium]
LIRDDLARHHERLQAATQRSLTIMDAARKVDALTREARVLAINARIEAHRVKSQATGLPVIADEMQRLAKTIAATNATIQELAYDLGRTLPAVCADSAEMVKFVRGFETMAAGQIDRIETQARELQADVNGAVAMADRAMGDVLASSQSALSHLQFQDVCAQDLLEVDLWLYDDQITMASQEDRADPVAPPAQQRVGDGTASGSQSAGDVLLF